MWAATIVDPAKVSRDSFSLITPFTCRLNESRLAQPLPDDPYNLHATDRPPFFNDQLGAILFFLATLRSHGYGHISACQRAQDRSRKGAFGGPQEPARPSAGPSTAGAVAHAGLVGRINRLQAAITYTGQRIESLRDRLGEWFLRVLAYIFLRFRPEGFAYEGLDMTTDGKTGGLAKIIASMFTHGYADFMQAAANVVLAAGAKVPDLKQVDARYTSLYCYDCGPGCVIDRLGNADFGRCLEHGDIVNCHVNACKNIASRHPNAPKTAPAGTGPPTGTGPGPP